MTPTPPPPATYIKSLRQSDTPKKDGSTYISAASWLRLFLVEDSPAHIRVITCKTQPGKNCRSIFIASRFGHHQNTFSSPKFVGFLRKLALSHFTPENKTKTKKTHGVVCKESNPRSVGLVLMFTTNKGHSEEALCVTLGKYKKRTRVQIYSVY